MIISEYQSIKKAKCYVPNRLEKIFMSKEVTNTGAWKYVIRY